MGPGKERFETSSPGVYAELEDYRRGRIWRGRHRSSLGGRRQDKGFAAQFRSLADVARRAAEPPPPEGYWLSTLTTLAAARSLESGRPETVLEHDAERPPEAAEQSEAKVVPGHVR